MIVEKEKRARLLGSDIRLLLGDGPSPEKALDLAIGYLQNFEATLSRFRPDSELSKLNKSQKERVKISPLLHECVGEALSVASKSGGVVDPTVLPGLKKSGYTESWNSSPLRIEELIKARPSVRIAKPSQEWKKIALEENGWIKRPVGIEIDLGGVGKGIAADHIAEKYFPDYSSWCVDLGGDLRFGGRVGKRTVSIPSPLGDYKEIAFKETSVATSGVWRRVWLKDGRPFHHLIDPKSGSPAWSDYLQVTAFAPTVKDAERISKSVLLLNDPSLLENGGLLLDWGGEWKVVNG